MDQYPNMDGFNKVARRSIVLRLGKVWLRSNLFVLTGGKVNEILAKGILSGRDRELD